jgi:hypothetical protein
MRLRSERRASGPQANAASLRQDELVARGDAQAIALAGMKDRHFLSRTEQGLRVDFDRGLVVGLGRAGGRLLFMRRFGSMGHDSQRNSKVSFGVNGAHQTLESFYIWSKAVKPNIGLSELLALEHGNLRRDHFLSWPSLTIWTFSNFANVIFP